MVWCKKFKGSVKQISDEDDLFEYILDYASRKGERASHEEKDYHTRL